MFRVEGQTRCKRQAMFAVSFRTRKKLVVENMVGGLYRGADKSLARPTFHCILFDGENISFDASLVIYINITNISPIVIINKIQ